MRSWIPARGAVAGNALHRQSFGQVTPARRKRTDRSPDWGTAAALLARANAGSGQNLRRESFARRQSPLFFLLNRFAASALVQVANSRTHQKRQPAGSESLLKSLSRLHRGGSPCGFRRSATTFRKLGFLCVCIRCVRRGSAVTGPKVARVIAGQHGGASRQARFM